MKVEVRLAILNLRGYFGDRTCFLNRVRSIEISAGFLTHTTILC